MDGKPGHDAGQVERAWKGDGGCEVGREGGELVNNVVLVSAHIVSGTERGQIFYINNSNFIEDEKLGITTSLWRFLIMGFLRRDFANFSEM